MSRTSSVLILSASLLLGALSRPAHAQWAVVDVGAIAQLVRQVATLQQQLQNAEQQLGQAREQYSSMTGGRGMQNLLTGVNRNYLPVSFEQLGSTLAVPIRATVECERGAQSRAARGAVGGRAADTSAPPAGMRHCWPLRHRRLTPRRVAASTPSSS